MLLHQIMETEFRSRYHRKPLMLDAGVLPFVQVLEQLGCRTLLSCEGHPNGFFIVFDAPATLAHQIRDCGFDLEVSKVGSLPEYWLISLASEESKPLFTRRKRKLLAAALRALQSCL